MNDRLPPPSPELLDAIAREHANETLPPSVRDRLRESIARAVTSGSNGPSGGEEGGPPDGSPSGMSGEPGAGPSSASAGDRAVGGAVADAVVRSAGLGSAPSIVAALLASAVIGAAVGSWVTARPEEPRAPARPVSEAVAPLDAGVRPTPTDAEDLDPILADPPPTPARSAVPASRRAAAPDLESERTLLDLARAALARGNTDAALAALDRHAREHPRGVLVEERDGLRVLALAAIDPQRARVEAERFARRHPDSLLHGAIERALGATGESAHEEVDRR